MAAPTHIRLLEADPDLGRSLSPDERAEARNVVKVTTRDIAPGAWDVATELRSPDHAFGAIILDGLVLHELDIEGRSSLQLLGPGDVLAAAAHTGAPKEHGHWTVAAGAQIAILDGYVLVAMHRWPQIGEGLFTRATDQLARLARQLAILQLPNVEQRLLAMFGLMAERWGRVTPAGVTIPIKLTHDLLGRLVGARRPTVTLAISELARDGRLVRQADRTWLLGGHRYGAGVPAASAWVPAGAGAPSLLVTRDEQPATPALSDLTLRRTIGELRRELAASRTDLVANLTRYEQTRTRSQTLREQVQADRTRRRDRITR